MGKVQCATNVPVELHFLTTQPQPVESQFGGNQALFSTSEGALYVSEAVGGILVKQIQQQRIQIGEPVEICKREVNQGNGRKSIQWQVSKVGFLEGEQPNGTFVVQGAGADTPAPMQASANGHSPRSNNNGNGSTPNGGSNGSNGHAAAAAPAFRPAPMKIPMNLAVIDAVRIVQIAMKETGEQWSDGARQDLVSTILITAQRLDWLTCWKLEGR